MLSWSADYDQIVESMRQRDEIDSQRAVAPLKPAPDAVIVNNDHLSIDDGVAFVERLLNDHAEAEK